ncbi:hypothetical protein ACHAWU_004770 [Discostella pseudostelligera]|uniref:Reverse transcriptase domain-containing protein n=1 Tax=Discostella pseudostelligera TaxID=259834 RepID=A0ABD3MJ84_9STRA
MDITSQEQIEQCLLERNQRHLEQTAREGGISTHPPLTHIRHNHGFNALTEQIINGTPITDYDLTPEMEHFFRALKRTPQERDLPPILGELTSEDIQQMFKKAKERTSSDSRTLNYTIWKAIATDDLIAGILSVLFSLPFSYGFANLHWTHMTDFMLEKKPGVRQIHTLRIIGKVAAEFNTCLKYFIGKRAMNNFEASHPRDEQHGFRPNRSPVDAAMLKLLTFESARMQKCTMGTIQHDMTAHFDRMYPAMTSVYAGKYGVDQKIMLSINRTISKLQRNVETALGVSSATYSQLPEAPEIGGMVQGKADVPQWSTQQSNAMLQAHTDMTEGLHIVSPNLSRAIRHNSVSFADDTDGQVSRPPTAPTPIPSVVQDLQHNAQVWNNLVNICGGLIALHKCNWQLIAWEMVSGHLRMVTTTSERLIMEDGKGAYAIIDFLPPDHPNVGLGFRICPDGNTSHHFTATKTAIERLCWGASGTHLTESEMRQLLHQRLLPKLKYALHATSFTTKECNTINTMIRGTIVPALRLNRHFPNAVLYGPIELGGLEFPDVATLQQQTQLDYLIKQLRWDQTVATALLVTLDNVQLCSGLNTPLLEHPHPPVRYLERSFLLDVRARLSDIGGSLWVEKAWTPPLQRVGDDSLMARFITIKGITTAQLKRANAVRLYLRVVTIADLCDPTGTFIPNGMLNGDWQAGSDLQWPFQPQPPKPFFATFRRCLRSTFCTNTPANQPAHYGMTLDTRLGDWLPVQRNTWFPVYRDNTNLYWRAMDDSTLHVLTRSVVSGFYHFSHTTDTLPLDSHPITYKQIGNSIWTRRPYRIHYTSTGQELPPGHIVANTLTNPATDTVTVGSDGSVYIDKEVAACAWMIADSETCLCRRASYYLRFHPSRPIEVNLKVYTEVCDMSNISTSPHYIFNNVNDSNKPLYTPSAMIKPDADLLLAIHHLRSQMERTISITCRHIYGHQDTKRRNTPQPFDIGNTSDSDDDDSDDLLLQSIQGLGPFSPPPQIHTHLDPAGPHRDDSTILPHHGPAILDHLLNTDSHDSLPPDSRRPNRPLSVSVNIECDRIASETATIALTQHRSDMPPVLAPPYPGSRALLRLGTTWITSKAPHHILRACWSTSLTTYCKTKYGWSDDTFQEIAWRNIRSARRKCTPTQLTKTSKIMHDWLPVMHMQAHITGISHCPSCTHPDETLDHIFHCPHPILTQKREELLEHLRKKGLSLRIPPPVLDAIVNLMGSYISLMPMDPTHPSDMIQAAITSQLGIGIHLMPRGYLSRLWVDALDAYHCPHPERALSNLIKFLLNDFTDSLWRTRNDLVHRAQNLTDLATEASIDERLLWYTSNKHDLLATTDHHLARFTEDTLLTMSLRTKKAWMKHLQAAEAAYTLEKAQCPSGQRLITDFFTRQQP